MKNKLLPDVLFSLVIGFLFSMLIIGCFGCSTPKRFTKIADKANEKARPTVVSWINTNYPVRTTGFDSSGYLAAIRKRDSALVVYQQQISSLDSRLQLIQERLTIAEQDTTAEGLKQQNLLLKEGRAALQEKYNRCATKVNDQKEAAPPVIIYREDPAKLDFLNNHIDSLDKKAKEKDGRIQQLQVDGDKKSAELKSLQSKLSGHVHIPTWWLIVAGLALGVWGYLRIRAGAISGIISTIKNKI